MHTQRRRVQVNTSPPPTIEFESESDSDYLHYLFDSDSEVVIDMADQRTLRELAAPDINYNGMCIDYDDVAAPFELKSGLIHLLPKFSGLAGEDPHKHLKEF